MKKIVRIIARLNIGGPAIHTILLSSEMATLGYETILVHGKEGPEEGNMDALAAEQGVKPVLLPELGREIRWGKDLITLWKLYRLIRHERPDIVHTHTAKAGTLGRLAAWLAGSPVILHTLHGHVFHKYFPPWKTKLFIIIERLMAKISTATITLSPTLKEELIRLRIASPAKIRVVPLGLELDRFRDLTIWRGRLRKELGVAPNAFLIGIVGRLVPIKNHRLFLEVAKAVIRRLQENLQDDGSLARMDIRFVIVGDGELRESLEQEARVLEISRQVVFLGFRQDLETVYADLDVVVLTSQNEGTPVCLIEAMAAGRAVVATRVGGVPDLLEDGVTGVVLPPGNPERLADAIVGLLSDPARRKQLANRAAASVYPKYDVRNLVLNLDKLYQDLLSVECRGRRSKGRETVESNPPGS